MAEHTSLDMDRLMGGSAVSSTQDGGADTVVPSNVAPIAHAPCMGTFSESNGGSWWGSLSSQEGEESTAEAADIQAECRICQEDDDVNNLETPCACSGSIKYAHRKCVQSWCNVKGDTICEICQHPYRDGYEAPPRLPRRLLQYGIIPLEFRVNDWGNSLRNTVASGSLNLLTMSAAQQHILDAEYDDYNIEDASGAAYCRTAMLYLILSLLLMVATVPNEDARFFALFFLKAAFFLFPFFIMLSIMVRAMNGAMSILQHRSRQRQEVAMAAEEVAVLSQQAGPAQEVYIAVAPEPVLAHDLP